MIVTRAFLLIRPALILAAMIGTLACSGSANAQQLSRSELVQALRHGGYVLVMRHASSPRDPPDVKAADPENTKLERQLDEAGRMTARGMGDAIRKLGLPIGDILSSPAYRALETVRIAALATPQQVSELADGGQSMQAHADDARAAWLRAKVAEQPRGGTDTLIVTHVPNILGAFADAAANIGDGECLVFKPDGKGQAPVVTRIKIEDWPLLATR